MANLFCLLKDIASEWGTEHVFMEDGTPFILSSFYPTTRLPKMILELFYPEHVITYRKECVHNNLWYTIYLGCPHDYHTIKVYIKK